MAHEFDSSSELPDWQTTLEAAKCETDPKKVASLLAATEDAIFIRLQNLNGNEEESKALARACLEMREIQVRKLCFPTWEGERFTQIPTPLNL